MFHRPPSPTAALKASKEHRPRYAWPRGSTQLASGKGADPANLSRIGADQPAPAGLFGPDGGTVAPNPSTVHGPPITRSPDGAGGPLNRWDREIAHWKAMGRHDLADGLQMARARFAIAFERLEPVFVPTDGQRLLYGLRACPTGLRVRDAA